MTRRHSSLLICRCSVAYSLEESSTLVGENVRAAHQWSWLTQWQRTRHARPFRRLFDQYSVHEGDKSYLFGAEHIEPSTPLFGRTSPTDLKGLDR